MTCGGNKFSIRRLYSNGVSCKGFIYSINRYTSSIFIIYYNLPYGKCFRGIIITRKINFGVSRNYHGYYGSAIFARMYRHFPAAHYFQPITNVRQRDMRLAVIGR